MLQGLCHEHDFVVFAAQFDNPCPDRIRFVRVPALLRPLAAAWLTYHVMAPICYLLYLLRAKQGFDLIQVTESTCLLPADVSYSQFCHNYFLRVYWSQLKSTGLRSFVKWIVHCLHRLTEPFVYERVTNIVVASRGLQQELEQEYPVTRGKIIVVPNPVDLARMRCPHDFDRAKFRADMGVVGADTLLVFVALGHFERKGLPLVLEALKHHADSRLKLNIVGGMPHLISYYRRVVQQMGIADRVIFSGMQKDVRAFLWSADGFIFPSFYETFSLVTFEAAAAGTPILVSHLNGVEDFLIDGENGILLERSAAGVAKGVRRLLGLTDAQRREMVQRAQHDAREYSVEQFQSNWRDVYDQLSRSRPQGSAATAVSAAGIAGVKQRDHAST